MKDTGHTYIHEEIIIGGNLNAILYAYKKNSPIICNTMDGVFAFDTIRNGITVGKQRYPAGTNIASMRRKLLYDLSLKGLNSFGNKVEAINLQADNKTITVRTKGGTNIFLNYSKLKIFNSDKINDMPFKIPKTLYYRVYDWFDVRSGAKHECEFLEDSTEFCSKIYFYISKRIDGNKVFKDLVCESLLTKRQLDDINYSTSISRLKVINMMKQAGIKGTGNGIGRNLPIRLELWKREIIPIKEKIVEKYNDIIFNNGEINE